jgi:hypothetical protein
MQQLSQRRSRTRSAQKSRAWAVATPLCAALSRPTPFGAEGRYRPSCSAGLSGPSLASFNQTQKENELPRIEEIKQWL